jgi:hypothetical protein
MMDNNLHGYPTAIFAPNVENAEILALISQENLAVYRESPSRLQEDVSQESQVAHDYRGRLVYELLQNADDALLGVATTDDRALFRLTDDELWVANTGRPFSDADVRGLCGLGASSKAQADGRRRASIGHKGLGFKSVLEITDSPEAYSDTVCFNLGRPSARRQVEALWAAHGRGSVRDVPAMRFPDAISSDQPVWNELRHLGLVRLGGARRALDVLDHDTAPLGEAAAVMHQELVTVLRRTPLLPASGRMLPLDECVLPSPVLGGRGIEFARLLTQGSTRIGRRFPDADFCDGKLAAICSKYGAVALSPAETLKALAESADPVLSALRPEPLGTFKIDPVLDLCVTLWENADARDRLELEQAARLHAVFPMGEREDGSVARICLGDETAFYPPRSSEGDLPLRRLRFLAHGVCWGSLGRTEQRSVLERQMKAWDALFAVKEFRFEEVMRAAVLPGLTRAGAPDHELREANRSIEALATICRLAGKTTKPDQPLPLERLGSDRAFFNLSRLDVPCRTSDAAEQIWAPAHQVYFGRDWIGADSVEDLADSMAEAGTPLHVQFLAAPATFAAYSAALGVQADDGEPPQVGAAADDGEVDLEDDTDQVLETTADDRWRNFFAWLGVSRGLRLVHFHDVDDAGTGWTNTKGLGLPGGWAFEHLGPTWEDYKAELERALAPHPLVSSTDHYLYEVHNLDKIDEIAAAASLKDNDVAYRLVEHLVRNWPTYAQYTQAELALVGAGKWPSSRTAPPRAATEERVTAGSNLWLFRLRRHAVCPTSQGPRRPEQTWRRSDELVRRLGRSGRRAEDFLPVLAQPSGVSPSSLRACLDELSVRAELTPGAFTLNDALGLCVRIAKLYADGVTEQALRTELRPIYRQLFELLVGTSAEGDPLADAPLAARTARGVEFLPAKNVVYASVAGSRERSGVQDKVPLFVLEAEPGALAPLRSLFRAPLLEEALEWSPMPGEAALSDAELAELRKGLRELVRPLLARLGADRPERGGTDMRAMIEFAERVEPVESLGLTCAFRGEDLGDIPQRNFYVRRSSGKYDFQGFVAWTGPAWPPVPEDAQTLAMALAEALGVNTVETFLSFINANDAQRRQLLDLAGAAERLDEVELELAEDADSEENLLPSQNHPAPEPTDGESTESAGGASPRVPSVRPPTAAPPVPLHRFEDLLIEGRVLRVEGTGSTPGEPSHGPGGGVAGPGGTGSPRAAAGMDLDGLDRLGMQITIGFERHRLGDLDARVLPSDASKVGARTLIVDVSSPRMIALAIEQSTAVAAVFERLAKDNISALYPGFDILTIVEGEVDRMIELKSSGVDAQVQVMSWNEWKTARGGLRSRFWLYLVGNLRSDVRGGVPFVRAVQDPFGTLTGSTVEDSIRKRTVQLRVREFAAADEMILQLRPTDHGT